MGLARLNPRRTVVITNLSFADGELELFNYKYAPLVIQEHANAHASGIMEFYQYCWAEDLLTDADLEFLASMSGREHVEIYTKLLHESGIDSTDRRHPRTGR